MKMTRAWVEWYAKRQGYEPLQEDGLPESFVWQEPSLIINGRETGKRIIRFIPLGDKDTDITYG